MVMMKLLLVVVVLAAAVASVAPGASAGKVTCELCVGGMSLVEEMLRNNKTAAEVMEALTTFCVVAKIETFPVCHGLIVNEFGPLVLDLIDNYGLKPQSVCHELRICDTRLPLRRRVRPPPRPASTLPAAPPPRARASAAFTAVHISDVHHDPFYDVGSPAHCNEPLCCRANSTDDGVKDPHAAQRWGEYNCDVNAELLDNFASQLAAMDPAPRYVLWTGDNTAHDVWEQSPEHELDILQRVSTQLQKSLGTAKDSPRVVPSLGNHDSYCVDQFQVGGAYNWLTNALADMWAPWLSDEAQQTFRKYGYYTQLLEPGLRALSLNTQFGDLLNFYLMVDDDDPGNQTVWAAQVLADAAAAGEKVWVLGHIPPGDTGSTVEWYGDWYAPLVAQYADVITGQFFGHTHNDHFELVWSDDHPDAVADVRRAPRASDAVATVYIAPSVTPFTNKNPSFRVMDIEPSAGFQLADYHQVFMNLSEANLNPSGQPAWRTEYSARKAYALEDLTPPSWAKLVDRFEDDDALFQMWYARRTALGPSGPCDASCKATKLCELRSASLVDLGRCKERSAA